MYIDEVEFTLQDLKVENGKTDDSIVVTVKPDEDKLVKISITGKEP